MSINVNRRRNLRETKASMLTLNEILTLIENQATAHLQVKQYGHGDVWEINPKELDYLVLWAIEESVVLV